MENEVREGDAGFLNLMGVISAGGGGACSSGGGTITKAVALSAAL